MGQESACVAGLLFGLRAGLKTAWVMSLRWARVMSLRWAHSPSHIPRAHVFYTNLCNQTMNKPNADNYVLSRSPSGATKRGLLLQLVPQLITETLSLSVAMAYAAQNPDKIHADVLSQARQACYKARDAFYACLERESNKKPTEIASVGLLYPVECKKPRDEYVKQCRPTWVKHFDRQYCAKKRVHRLLDDNESRRGPLSLPQPYTFKPTNCS